MKYRGGAVRSDKSEYSNNRVWRTNRELAQPFYHYECDDVVVGPSRIYGLGVFAQRDFTEGDLVCMYGGLCVK